jgi:hypothetical protein
MILTAELELCGEFSASLTFARDYLDITAASSPRPR